MSNDECLKKPEARMTNERRLSGPHPFDLEERTAKFGEAIIEFVKSIPVTEITGCIISQLIRSATSVGANYCEADDAGSRKEFKYRTQRLQARITRVEALASHACCRYPRKESTDAPLWIEAKGLHLIFAAIFRGTSRL